MSSENLYSPPTANLEMEDADTDLSMLHVSDKWRERFRLIQRAGGVKLNKLKELPFGERMKVTFNVLAVLFGPFYYCAKGMWKKGLSLFAATSVAVIAASILLDMFGLGDVSQSLGIGAAVVFAIRANIDYYKKMVLKENGWW